ncbi:hypothetical protein ACFY7C_23745 [Streptomyces sp. NPDC012769]|uniref:hypothetical protein n=1 Tax=Streptomyces sp. NPDC012769 TaxID=3364848 RepID=UPI0036CF4DF8
MRINRFVSSAGISVSALFLATAAAVSGGLLQGAGSVADSTGRIVADDHGWGVITPGSAIPADGTVVLAGGTDDHGWG